MLHLPCLHGKFLYEFPQLNVCLTMQWERLCRFVRKSWAGHIGYIYMRDSIILGTSDDIFLEI